MTLQELLDHFGVEYKNAGEHHHVTSGWIGVDCPYCSPDSHHFRMGLQIGRERSNCWICGSHFFWSALNRVTEFATSISALEKMLDPMETGKEKEEPQGKFEFPPCEIGPFRKPHIDYLRSRNFKPKQLTKLWDIKGIGLASAKFAWSLFIPVFHNGFVVSWATRKLTEKGRRYRKAGKHQEGLPAKNLLYGMDLVRGHSLIVMEGFTDVWRIGPGSVATMGVVYTLKQAKLIADYPTRYICFDNEPDAQRRATKLCRMLAGFPGKTVRLEIDADDPGSAKPKEISRIRKLLLT